MKIVNLSFNSNLTLSSALNNLSLQSSGSGDIGLSQMPKAMFELIRQPGIIDPIKKLTLLLPFSAIPLAYGLYHRRKIDPQVSSILAGGQNSLDQHDVNASYLYLYSFMPMMLNAALNGFFGFASGTRSFSYLSLFLTSLYNLIPENKVINNSQEIGRLRKQIQENPALKTLENQKKIQDLTSDTANNVGFLVYYGRILFPLLMNFTFWANAMQNSISKQQFDKTLPKGPAMNKLWGEIKQKFVPNFKQELSIAKDITFNEIFSKQSWKEVFQTFTGKNHSHERLANSLGLKKGSLNRFLHRFESSKFNRKFILINMYGRSFSALLSWIAITGWSSGLTSSIYKVFLTNDEHYNKADPEVNKLAEAGKTTKSGWKRLFDFATVVGNIFLIFMGISSIMMNNRRYRANSGALAGMLQVVGGSFLLASATSDQFGGYLIASTLRIMSNAFLQFANIFSTTKSNIAKLQEKGLLKTHEIKK